MSEKTNEELAQWWLSAVDDPIWTQETREVIAITAARLRQQSIELDYLNHELSEYVKSAQRLAVEKAELRRDNERLRQQSEDSARVDALNAMVNGNIDGVEIRQDFAGPGQCLIVNCQNFYGPDIRAVIDKARK